MRIMIVDDDPIVSNSLKVIIESDKSIESEMLTVIGIASSGKEAVILYKELSPDVVVMDIRMEGMNGLDASESILAFDKSAKIMLLTTFVDDEYIAKALRVGVRGYVLKQDLRGLGATVRAIYDGQMVFGSKIVSKLPDILNRKSRFDFEAHGLSARDMEIIELISDGKSNKEISDTLFLSEGTVRNEVSIILDKLELRDRTQLACYYYQEINP